MVSKNSIKKHWYLPKEINIVEINETKQGTGVTRAKDLNIFMESSGDRQAGSSQQLLASKYKILCVVSI
jgi:hypothetical protein